MSTRIMFIFSWDLGIWYRTQSRCQVRCEGQVWKPSYVGPKDKVYIACFDSICFHLCTLSLWIYVPILMNHFSKLNWKCDCKFQKSLCYEKFLQRRDRRDPQLSLQRVLDNLNLFLYFLFSNFWGVKWALCKQNSRIEKIGRETIFQCWTFCDCLCFKSQLLGHSAVWVLFNGKFVLSKNNLQARFKAAFFTFGIICFPGLFIECVHSKALL